MAPVEGAAVRTVLVRGREREVLGVVACAAALAFLTWPIRTLTPDIGGDWEWITALSYAAEHHLHFGSQIVWTYGPLGFLETWWGAVLYYPDTLTVAWLYRLLLQVLLAVTLLGSLRRALPLPVAVLLAGVVLALVREQAVVLCLAWCVLLVMREKPDEQRRRPFRIPPVALPLALGALTGVAALGKLNQGAELLALVVIALAAACRRRDALACAGAFLATAAVGWAATGQRLADVWPYVRNGLETAAGYAAAMGQGEGRGWLLPLALALSAAALLLAWDAGRHARPRRRAGLVALSLVFVVFTFKEAFVRQDAVHMLVLFGDLPVLFALLLTWGPRRRALSAAIAASAVCAVAWGAVAGSGELVRALNPYANARALTDQAGVVASSARQDAIIVGVRLEAAALSQLSPRLVQQVGPRAVMFWPSLYGEVAYAYGMNLRPLVGLEPYGTYTPRLDRLSAQALESDRGAPARVLDVSLEAVSAIDGRYATFEAPLATRELFCRYRQIAAQQPWQLLARTASRCGAPRTLRTTTARWGAEVEVPRPRRPHALVLVRIDGAGVHGLERLRELLLRPLRRWISLDEARYRLIAATAPDGLLLSAPAADDYPQPYALAPDPRRIAVGRDGGEPGGMLRYTFVEVPLRRFPGAAAGGE